MEKDQIKYPVSLVVIGGSAGSLQVILYLLENLPEEFDIPLLLVLHRDPQGESRLVDILSFRTGMTVKEIEDKDSIEKRHIYVCPADYHVLVEADGSFSLDYSEKEHFSRPSIDVAFRAAADVFGPKLACLLLSGANADGADGLGYVKERNGITVVQHPEDAAVSYMPEQAILHMRVDQILDMKDISRFLQRLFYSPLK